MRIVAIIIAVSLIVFLALCFVAGIFDPLTATIGEAGPFCVVYREHTGSYDNVKYSLYDVSKYLKDKRAILPRRGFALLLDDPAVVAKDKLRSESGYMTDTLLTNVSQPYKSGILSKKTGVIATFPLRSFLSPMTGPVKFYPKMAELLTKNNLRATGEIMEIYDMVSKRIVYFAPVK
jgi:hypothetical protein